MPYLPVELHPEAYQLRMRASGRWSCRWFGAHLRPRPAPGRGPAAPAVPTVTACVESAMDTRDKHAIKLAEVCVRSMALHADNEPYVRAVGMLVERLPARSLSPVAG